MGTILGKSKSVLMSEKANGHTKEVIINSNNHNMDGTTTLEKKLKKKKEKISNKKSSDLKADKYTSTDGNAISTSSAYIKQLVRGSRSNHVLYDAQVNLINQSETPSQDVLELRNACIRRGIISAETNNITLPTSIEQDQQENITNTVEESTNETATIVVTNDQPIQNEQQVES
jgi:hypothetical protein